MRPGVGLLSRPQPNTSFIDLDVEFNRRVAKLTAQLRAVSVKSLLEALRGQALGSLPTRRVGFTVGLKQGVFVGPGRLGCRRGGRLSFPKSGFEPVACISPGLDFTLGAVPFTGKGLETVFESIEGQTGKRCCG